MKSEPLVSVIIPTYNRVGFLKEALLSVLNQSYLNIEVVISDNSSIDGTEEFVKSLTDLRIKYYRQKENIGVLANHNFALTKCSGEYIHFFSDDDIMIDNNCIKEKVSILLDNPTIGVVHSNIKIIDSLGNLINDCHWSQTSVVRHNLVKRVGFWPRYDVKDVLFNDWNIISMPSVLMRKSVITQVKFLSNNTFYFCDWDLWLKASYFVDFFYLGKKLVAYRQHSKNVTKEKKSLNVIKELYNMKQNFRSLEVRFPFLFCLYDLLKSIKQFLVWR